MLENIWFVKSFFNWYLVAHIKILTIFSLFQRIPLDFLKDEKFQEAAENYIRPLLTKVCDPFQCMCTT